HRAVGIGGDDAKAIGSINFEADDGSGAPVFTEIFAYRGRLGRCERAGAERFPVLLELGVADVLDVEGGWLPLRNDRGFEHSCGLTHFARASPAGLHDWARGRQRKRLYGAVLAAFAAGAVKDFGRVAEGYCITSWTA